MADDQQLSVDDFAAKVKAKYPEYANVDNRELTARVIAKYPEYAGRVTVNSTPQAQTPQELAAQAMRASGVPVGGQVAPTTPKVNMQEQSGAYLGNVANSASGQLSQWGNFLKAGGGDAVDQVKGNAGMVRDVLRNGNGTLEGMQMALGRHLVEPIVQSANDPNQSKAETAGQLLGVNSQGVKDSALQNDYAGIAGHSVLPLLTAFAAGRLAPEIENPLPSKARAGENFAQVKAAAGDTPISIDQPGTTALEIDRLAKSGGSMPKVVRDFLKRTTDPEQGPLTYAEARDFYSNASRISADEFNRLTPVMKMRLGQFTYELGKSIKGAAEDAGVGEKYASAMNEYRNASRLANGVDAAKGVASDALKKAAPVAAAAYAGKKVWDASQ